MNEKEEIIKEAYETNFGTSYDTYTIAVNKSPNIILSDVKYYLSKRGDILINFKHKQYTSVVSSKPLFGFDVDLLDMGATVKPIRYGFVAVDGFTKVVSVIPLKNKQVNEIIRGLEEVFAIMGTPQQIYTDEEGAMNSDTFLTFINKHKFNTYKHQHMPIQQRGLFKRFV